MKLISQDKMTEVPYETSVLKLQNDGVSLVAFADGVAYPMGTYGNASKGYEALVSIRNKAEKGEGNYIWID